MIPWKFSKSGHENMVGYWRTYFDERHHTCLHALLENLPLSALQVTSPNFSTICESWKHQCLELMGFEFPMCDSDSLWRVLYHVRPRAIILRGILMAQTNEMSHLFTQISNSWCFNSWLRVLLAP